MKKTGYGSKSAQRKGKASSYSSFKDRDLMNMSPEKAQEACKPTEGRPVNMHKRMAGCE